MNVLILMLRSNYKTYMHSLVNKASVGRGRQRGTSHVSDYYSWFHVPYTAVLYFKCPVPASTAKTGARRCMDRSPHGATPLHQAE